MKKSYVYRLYDKHHNLLYIGSTSNPSTRLQQHKKASRGWRSLIKYADLSEPYPRRFIAEMVEREAIREERPLYNVSTLSPRPKLPTCLEGYIAAYVEDIGDETEAYAAEFKIRDDIQHSGVSTVREYKALLVFRACVGGAYTPYWHVLQYRHYRTVGDTRRASEFSYIADRFIVGQWPPKNTEALDVPNESSGKYLVI